ncbi:MULTISPECIES: SDR family NAD(P)-dependent oxidoreductase [Methylorubrum]|jgi:NAD(P)-dependent dehydrogenase (short-subunit alcohol dehydrogenase family)|uniref:Short-chain dehydrogenase/reductase SDR n=1 Tax=Methylorubrum extorquens DSM 13060 TaxID=882800 RepID=H1KQA1_METEX|nr:SDR family NAD(P)-dependent oxidoreductase [Methylorubrum extorquens]EHP90294.1 short-chain dehydrogenase/reductase SDR [Methylorubrum extorquens DSM 13060]
MSRFEKRRVIIGAGSGIGAATAKRFASEGASVVPNGRDRGKLDRRPSSEPGRFACRLSR